MEDPEQAFAGWILRNEEGLGFDYVAVDVRTNNRAVVVVIIDIASYHATGDNHARRSHFNRFSHRHRNIVDVPAVIAVH